MSTDAETPKKRKRDGPDGEGHPKRRRSKPNKLAVNGAEKEDGEDKGNAQGQQNGVTATATPAKATPAKDAPVTMTPAKTTPAKATPAKATPAKATPVQAALVKATPAKDTPATSARATPAKTPSKKSPKKKHRQSNAGREVGMEAEKEADDANELEDVTQSGWRLSKPTGGRIADIDPVLTPDQKYLILTYNTAIQVYSTEDSLLVRRIPIPVSVFGLPTRIVATRPSRVSPGMIWVACSNGCIYHIDWASSAADNKREKPRSLHTNSGTCTAMALLEVRVNGKPEDILLVAERHGKSAMISAYKGNTKGNTSKGNASKGNTSKGMERGPFATLTTMADCGHDITTLEACQEGMAVFGAAKEMVCATSLRGVEGAPLKEWKCESYRFDAPHEICCLDVRARGLGQKAKMLDLILGTASGIIYHYRDVLSILVAKEANKLVANRFHWHQRAVHSLKWSRDGRYMISGGSETTLVLWQMETSKKDYLPHLPASIENIVVSADGSSYVLHLDDNSVMVISTAEMNPTSYIAGIQSVVVNTTPSKDLLVQRVWEAVPGPVAPIPAAMHPKDPTKLHLCVGNGQQAYTSSAVPSAPWLQTFDLASFRNHSKHAIARTNPTASNITSKGVPIIDPHVTHMRFSADGKWLATVDEWDPTTQDISVMEPGTRELLRRQRREVYLKFWAVSESGNFALVSRINSPHATTSAETVFDMAVRTDTSRFSTVGGDGMVRTWRPLIREQDGVRIKGADGQDTHKWVSEMESDLGSVTRSEIAAQLGKDGHTSELAGSLVYSDDGSTLFVAYGNWTDGTVYVVDTATAQIRHTMHGLWKGSICKMAFLSSYLFTVSDYLRTWDIISGELCYGIELPNFEQQGASNAFIQVSRNQASGCIAVVVPQSHDSTDIAIFTPAHSTPVFHHQVDGMIVALAESAGATGFVILDDRAQVLTLTEVGDKGSAVRVVQTLEDMRIDEKAGALDLVVMDMDEEEEDDDDEEGEGDAQNNAMDVDVGGDEDEDMIDGDMEHAAVVSREALASVFDSAPVFAMGSMEDLFNQVVGLVSQKHIAA